MSNNKITKVMIKIGLWNKMLLTRKDMVNKEDDPKYLKKKIKELEEMIGIQERLIMVLREMPGCKQVTYKQALAEQKRQEALEKEKLAKKKKKKTGVRRGRRPKAIRQDFSEETSKKFSNEFDKNLNLILPNRIDRMMEAGRVIDGNIGFAEGSLPVPETLPFANDIVIFQLLDQITNKEGEVDPYLPIRNICHAGPFVTASDAFLPLKAIQEFPEMMMTLFIKILKV